MPVLHVVVHAEKTFSGLSFAALVASAFRDCLRRGRQRMLGVPHEENLPLSQRLAVAVLKRAFYRTDPVTCARALVGCRVQWGTRSGRVVETEAYDAEGDEASHTFFRPSARKFVEDHREGAAYVYFNYGMHWMLNVLVKGGPRTGFVLIRALEPLTGIDEMRLARGKTDVHQLCSGPGKLAQALGVTGADHGRDLCVDRNFAFHAGTGTCEVIASPRVGITRAVEFPWRFFAAESRHVSAHPKGWKRENASGGK